jgi:hypothetical protein
LFSALRVRLDDASVWGVLETDWLTRDCGRCCECDDEAVGGGMGEGSSWLLAVLEKEGCVWVLPWAESGLRKGA